METVWVLGDQLNRRIASLAGRTPEDTRVLFIESAAKIGSKPYHRQRLHLVITAMRRFAAELGHEGFTVDYRASDSFAAGLAEHRRRFGPDRVVAMEPMSYHMLNHLANLGVEVVRSNQFLCHNEASSRRSRPIETGRRERRVAPTLESGELYQLPASPVTRTSVLPSMMMSGAPGEAAWSTR